MSPLFPLFRPHWASSITPRYIIHFHASLCMYSAHFTHIDDRKPCLIRSTLLYSWTFVVCMLVCTPSWASHADTNVFRGQLHGSTSLTTCQDACFNNASCTGLDWDPDNPDDQFCWFSGPWSGPRNHNGAPGVTHYDLYRVNCTTG